MKSYPFANLTVRPFPNIADVNNPWIFGGVQVLINVSGNDYSKEIRNVLESKGIEMYWFPLVEEGPDMGLDNIIKALGVLKQSDCENKKVILHCDCGNNRSRTVAELFCFIKTGEQIEDDNKGYANHLLYNIAEGHLPGVDELIVKYSQSEHK